jgi:hypothetical protein
MDKDIGKKAKLVAEAGVEGIFNRIQNLAKFARSVLHLPFPALEQVNPSFSVIAAYCEFVGAVLREEAHSGTAHAEDLALIMRDIATAIIDRDDKSLIDSMTILDDFTDKLSAQMPALAVVKTPTVS